jgi:hypothetical protein
MVLPAPSPRLLSFSFLKKIPLLVLVEITDAFPAPILRDFHRFLDELTESPSALTHSLNLSRKRVFSMNQKMSWKVANVTERSDLIFVSLAAPVLPLNVTSRRFSSKP